MAQDSETNQEKIGAAVEMLLQKAEQLINIIDNVNHKVTCLAAATEEIAAATQEVGEVSTNLKEKMEELVQ